LKNIDSYIIEITSDFIVCLYSVDLKQDKFLSILSSSKVDVVNYQLNYDPLDEISTVRQIKGNLLHNLVVLSADDKKGNQAIILCEINGVSNRRDLVVVIKYPE
jgi:hypothetical protein